MSDSELTDIARRIQLLVEAPHEVRDILGRIARPVFRVLKWQPEIRTTALSTVLTSLDARLGASPEELAATRSELEANVSAVERACVVHAKVPIAYATWLWKLYHLVARVSAWRDAQDDERENISRIAELDLLPPLAARSAEGVVHVVAIDPLIDAARSETELLGRRRALLEAARVALLDAAAALELDESAVVARQTAIMREIARIDRMQATGIAPHVALTHQLRQAWTRGEVQRAHSSLVALAELSGTLGDRQLSTLARRGLDIAWQGHDRWDPQHRSESLARSSKEVFGELPATAIGQGLERARLALEERSTDELTEREDRVLEKARNHLARIGPPELLRSALFVDGCFELGGATSPVRVTVEERRISAVTHPTPDLALLPARSIEDVRDAVIDDPRRILFDLAAGRLLARRYLMEEVQRHERTVMRSQVRIYVLDGSSSMLGPRAAMRDAILVAELTTLRARLLDPRRTIDSVLFYSYFNTQMEPPRAVRTREEVERAMADSLSRVRTGGTNIQQALFTSFELVREARTTNPELSRAQIVLVTDGKAPVDEARIRAVREAAGDVPIGVSIIALGQENPGLRALMARQRAQGERCFYHYLPDEEIEDIVDAKREELPLHLPESLCASALSAELGKVVDEIEQYRRGVDATTLAHARETRAAERDLGVPQETRESEALRARIELLERDWSALGRRFDRWFPPLTSSEPALEPPGVDEEDLRLLVTLLASLVEVVEMTPSDKENGKMDAIELFERLLVDVGLAPWRVHELMLRHPAAVAAPIRALRSLVGADRSS